MATSLSVPQGRGMIRRLGRDLAQDLPGPVPACGSTVDSTDSADASRGPEKLRLLAQITSNLKAFC